MPKQYSEDFRMQIVAICQEGMSVSEVSEEYVISKGTIYRWLRDYSSDVPGNGVTPAGYRALSKKSLRLEHLLQIIRLSNIIDNVPLRKRLEILAEIYEQSDLFSVHELCDALHVARGTFYNHIFRRADRTEYLQEQMMLMQQVQQIFDDSEQRYGAEKIRAVLAESGIRTSKKRILGIMRELGLQSIRISAKSEYKKNLKRTRQNLVHQQFSVDKPNLIWVGDFTYFKVKDYSVFLCVIIDLYSRRVIGYRISRKSSTHLVTSTFREAFQNRGCPKGLTFHSDRGSQYTSATFGNLLKQYGVAQSFSKTSCPYDNAVAETFFATFKKEEAYRRDYTSEQDFRRHVDQFIRFYNEVRPHQTLAYKSPARFEETTAGIAMPSMQE